MAAVLPCWAAARETKHLAARAKSPVLHCLNTGDKRWQKAAGVSGSRRAPPGIDVILANIPSLNEQSFQFHQIPKIKWSQLFDVSNLSFGICFEFGF